MIQTAKTTCNENIKFCRKCRSRDTVLSWVRLNLLESKPSMDALDQFAEQLLGLQSTQMVGEVQAHPHPPTPPGQTLRSNRTYVSLSL